MRIEMRIDKLTTGVEKLDLSLGGGIPKNHLILLTGTAGTMKSTLAFQFAYSNVCEGKRAIYITLEQNATSIITQVMSMNFDLKKIRINSNNLDINNVLPHASGAKKGLLTILDIGYVRINKTPIDDFSWLREIKKQLVESSKKGMLDIVVLDSLTALFHLEKFSDVRSELFNLFEFLRGLNTTSFIVNEMPPGEEKYTRYGIESYLVDGVILLSMNRREFLVNREISIVKMRHCDHSTNIFVIKFDSLNGSFKIMEKLQK